MRLRCPLCDSQFTFGPNVYKGQKAILYDIVVCNSCWKSNWDGWSPAHEEKLLRILQEKSLPAPPRNSKGLLPR